MTGSGSASATPDMVDVDLRISRQGQTVGSTLHDVDDVVRRVLQVLTDSGIAEADVRTSSTGIHQRHDENGRRTNEFTGYHSLRVGVRDIDAVSDIVDAVVRVGDDAVTIDGIQLAIADTAPLLVIARERAFADARDRAAEYAGYAGRTLGEVLWIGDAASAPEPRMYAMRAAAADSAGGLTIAPGESSVTAQLSVRFAWVAAASPDDE